MRGSGKSSQNVKKSSAGCGHSGSMLTELRKGRTVRHRMDPNLAKLQKGFAINQGEKLVNKERGQLSAKEEGVFNASKWKVKLLG